MPTLLNATVPGLEFESIGEQTNLELLADFSDGTTFRVTQSSHAAYSSLNTAVATVDSSGAVTATGPGSTTISVVYTLSGQSIQFPIPVNVSPPMLSVSPASLVFGTQNVGTTSPSQQLTLANASGKNVSVLAVTSGGDFSETDNCVASSPLGISSSCIVNVTFSPTAAGTRTGTLSIANSANLVPISIALSGTGGTAPGIISLNPTSGAVGTSVTISGANFGSTQGTSTVKFNGTAATPTSWSATSIVAPVPTGATTGTVVVTVGGVASNGVSFTVTTTAPAITSLSPTSGAVGTSVTISGANFGSTQGTSTVKFNGTPATPTSWSGTSIVAPVPSGATSGNVVVTVGGVASNGVNFTVTAPPAIAWSPTAWNTTGTRGCTGTGSSGCPEALFTLTNSGSSTVTSVATPTITGSSDFHLQLATANKRVCGPNAPPTGVAVTTLSPGQNCAVAVIFEPTTADIVGSVLTATLSVTDSAGTQTVTLSGTVQ